MSLADDAALNADRQALKERNAEVQKSKYDDRSGKAAILATNCLGCGCEEGSFHGKTCPWIEENIGATKLLNIDIKRLIESYGLRPRWASLSRDGVLTIAGHSKEA